MIVGIKYCGGCNPRFDRVAEACALARDYPQHCFVRAGCKTEMDLLLVICGCQVACADISGLHPKSGILYARNKSDLLQVKDVLDQLPNPNNL